MEVDVLYHGADTGNGCHHGGEGVLEHFMTFSRGLGGRVPAPAPDRAVAPARSPASCHSSAFALRTFAVSTQASVSLFVNTSLAVCW